jgi:hypothetical protein
MRDLSYELLYLDTDLKWHLPDSPAKCCDKTLKHVFPIIVPVTSGDFWDCLCSAECRTGEFGVLMIFIFSDLSLISLQQWSFSFSFSKLMSLRIYDLMYLKNREECLSVLKSHLPYCNIEILERVPKHQYGQSEQSQK